MNNNNFISFLTAKGLSKETQKDYHKCVLDFLQWNDKKGFYMKIDDIYDYLFYLEDKTKKNSTTQ